MRTMYSKKIVKWVIWLTTLAVVADIVLAYCGRNTNGETTRTVITALAVTVVGYGAKSAFEKRERNKYNLDADGNPRERMTENAEDEKR